MKTTATVLSILFLTAACGEGDVGDPKAGASATVTVTTTVTVTAIPDRPQLPPYPKGYPKKVRVVDVPFPMNSEFEGETFAVAVAPGVWTRMAPGTTVQEAADYGTYAGHCSSIRAFENKYKPEPRGNSCW